MPPTGNEVDASFFELIHQMGVPVPPARRAERRGQRRWQFASTQRIAPVRAGKLPDESQFFQVRCHDLNRAGFSFLLPTRPNFSTLVAAFGRPPEAIYVYARVSHCGSVLLYPSGELEHVRGRAGDLSYELPGGEAATPMVLVGCRFTGRVDR